MTTEPQPSGRRGAYKNLRPRQKGPARKTLARLSMIEKGVLDGVAPLDVMLDNMRFAHDKAKLLTRQLEEIGNAPTKETQAETKDRQKKGAALFKEMMRFREMSQDCASTAAPFVHPRLTAISVKPPPPEGGMKFVVEGGLPTQPEFASKPTEDELRGILEGTAVDVTPKGHEE